MSHTETFIDGIWFPSVTTIMGAEEKPWLKAWRDRWGERAERKMRLSAAIGTEFHRCVEEWLDGKDYAASLCSNDGMSPNMKKRVDGMVDSWVRWANGIDGSIIWTELKVVSRAHVYSGTLDAVGVLGKKPTIFDWKTSARIYPEMQLQLAAYAQAYQETTGAKPVMDGLIVHVSKDKPHHKVTTKAFRLGKRPFSKFLKLRENFDAIMAVIPKEAV